MTLFTSLQCIATTACCLAMVGLMATAPTCTDDSPKITEWVESIAEHSTMMVSKKHGFAEGVE